MLAGAANNGGIVDSLLAQNGYVKFANGLILQWGKILGDTVNLKVIDFPVPFNECFGGVTLFNGDPVAAAEYATITDITNAILKFICMLITLYWLCKCKYFLLFLGT